MTIFVTPAERDLARLEIELSKHLGDPVDPAVKAIAEARPADPVPPVVDENFRTQVKLAERTGLLDAVRARYEQGVSREAALRQVLYEHTDRVGAVVLAELTLARESLDRIKARQAEKTRILLRQRDAAIGKPVREVVFEPVEPSSGLPETSESTTEVHDRAR